MERNFPVIPIFRNCRPTSRGTPKILEWNSGKWLFHSYPNPEFPEFLVEWKAPPLLGLARFYVLRDQTKITCCESIHVLHEAPFQINHAEASCFMRCNFLAQFQFVLGRGTDSFKKLTCFLIRNLSPTLWDSAQIFHRSFGTRMYLAVGERVLSSEAWEA